MEPVEFRRRLHAHPELSFKEHDTAAFIEQQLDELGIEHRRIASTGVVARIKGRKTPEGDRRAAVLRADIDALPVTERNDCEWRSQNEGVMHACGHDMHAAVLFGVLFAVGLVWVKSRSAASTDTTISVFSATAASLCSFSCRSATSSAVMSPRWRLSSAHSGRRGR